MRNNRYSRLNSQRGRRNLNSATAHAYRYDENASADFVEYAMIHWDSDSPEPANLAEMCYNASLAMGIGRDDAQAHIWECAEASTLGEWAYQVFWECYQYERLDIPEESEWIFGAVDWEKFAELICKNWGIRTYKVPNENIIVAAC